MNRRYAIVEAPSVLGLRPTGVETLPHALLGAGLARRLKARRTGRIEPPPYDDHRDPETLMLNPKGIAEYTLKLADAIGEVLDTGDFPAVTPALELVKFEFRAPANGRGDEPKRLHVCRSYAVH